MDTWVGKVIAGYKLTERLGISAFKATHPDFPNKLFVMKLLTPQLEASDSKAEIRITREIRALKALDHPNIIELEDNADYDGMVFFVTEYKVGSNLRQFLNTTSITPAERLYLLEQLADAIDYAHGTRSGSQWHIIHRDIKPENIVIEVKDNYLKPYLVDFGIARLQEMTRVTNTGRGIGTARYMAPEVWEGRDPSPSMDIYALGIIAFEMITGEVPFDGPSDPAIMRAHLDKDVPLENLISLTNQDVAFVIQKVLHKDPNQRYRSAGDFVEDLRSAFRIPSQRKSQAYNSPFLFPPNIASEQNPDPVYTPGRPSRESRRAPTGCLFGTFTIAIALLVIFLLLVNNRTICIGDCDPTEIIEVSITHSTKTKESTASPSATQTGTIRPTSTASASVIVKVTETREPQYTSTSTATSTRDFGVPPSTSSTSINTATATSSALPPPPPTDLPSSTPTATVFVPTASNTHFPTTTEVVSPTPTASPTFTATLQPRPTHTSQPTAISSDFVLRQEDIDAWCDSHYGVEFNGFWEENGSRWVCKNPNGNTDKKDVDGQDACNIKFPDLPTRLFVRPYHWECSNTLTSFRLDPVLFRPMP